MSNKRPNLVLVMTDQQRWDALSIAGHPHLMTPNLDALAATGAHFRCAYSESPTCVPARHCVMTGQKPSTSGVVGFATQARIRTPNTLPNLLRLAGYQTASVGRNMHTHPGWARYGFEYTAHDPWEEVYSEFHKAIPRLTPRIAAFPHNVRLGLTSNGCTTVPWPYEDRFHQTNVAMNKAVEFIDRRDKDVPFFLYVGTVAPHPPFLPPPFYLDRYMRQDLAEPVIGDWVDELPNNGLGRRIDCDRLHLSGRFSQAARAGYYALVNHIDDQLANLLLRLRIEKEETYVIFTSDHGEMLGDHNYWRKYQPYEGSAHIPMIINGPGIKPGTVVDKAVNLMDVLPTFLELAGLDVPDSVDGDSLLRLCENPAAAWREYCHGEHSPCSESCPDGTQYLTDGKRKYTWGHITGTEHFFDLEKDPYECRDLIHSAERQAEVGMWRNRLVKELNGRPEGFTDGERLVTGGTYDMLMPHARIETASC